ncbi:GmrSD restriction endonuclease domain-containing protein [Selenomonas flueggei]|uniref:GmrSD restriction endonucleases N-terminal domain-containing protein n=1 Tax=Selenomonas flueggei ATCC 43531 TaxID=638302 RepID=C4V1C8_9FIRM|nr:DUF262 domain-containing protein [Selenomonas flueggei]EEQ49464.1 hypothetical protein HMPREF0908_0322 [Selenomonas flueggei ATCC 43531]
MQTNDKPLVDLMRDIHEGRIQLPDFQRGWIWDDNRIRGLIASITRGFPVGAAMFLSYGGDSLHFKYRLFEGISSTNSVPNDLVLDGQQRLTSAYSALYGEGAVRTRTDKGKEIYRYYYISIEQALDADADRLDAIISVPETKQLTSDFGRKVELDLTTPNKEYAAKMFPLNIILDPAKTFQWEQAYLAHYRHEANISKEYSDFKSRIVMPAFQYKIPVITLEKDTPKEAVCQVFENVNQGGVSLTVFELVTAIFAMEDFDLRQDWEHRVGTYFSGDLLNVVTSTDFLTACTLLAAYQGKGTVSCKKKDVLNLKLTDYKAYADALCEGFREAVDLLAEERIFARREIPYTTQLIPLAVLCTLLLEKNQIKSSNVKQRIKQWYWCGVFGELYGSANETRYVNDVVGVMRWLDGGELPKTVQDAYFNAPRLLLLRTRQSAAYKGVMALILKHGSKDFISGQDMDFTQFKAANIDIHHIFPRSYCIKSGLPEEKWDSVINKTPISYITNREIGGAAPSEYLKHIAAKVDRSSLTAYLSSHWISMEDCETDDFDAFMRHRATALLDAVSAAMGKRIVGRDSEEIVQKFGVPI